MMDVSNTDPRTRTGLFLWPWASYPAAAAHTQSIMMGGNPGAVSGSNMFGVPYSVGAPTSTVPGVMDDPFGSFYQRFSYSGAHAAHMSQIFPHHQPTTNLNESRHLTRDHEEETSEHRNRSPHGLTNHSRTHISQRLQSPQSCSNHHQHTNGGNQVNESTCLQSPNSHAAALVAFASAAAANSGIISNGEQNLETSNANNGFSFSHGIPASRPVQPMVLDELCNGFGKNNNHFSSQLHSTVTNALNRHQQQMSAPPKLTNCGKLQSPDALTPYNFNCQHLKGLNNTAAVALAAAAVANEHVQFNNHSTANEVNNELGKLKRLSDQTSTVVNRSHTNDVYSHTQRQQSYLFSSKSPLSDSIENLSTNGSTIGDAKNNVNGIETSRTNGMLSVSRSASFLFHRNSPIKDSPESTAEQRSADIIMDDRSRDDVKSIVNGTTNGNANHSNDSRYHRLNQDDNASITALCNGEGSLSSLVSLHNNGNSTNSYHPPAKGYKCKICQHVCFSRHDLSAHNAATHKQDPRPYRCEQCGRQFSTCAYLSQHRRIHTGVKPYACRYCDRRFTQLSHVQQHERIHTGEKPYRCSTCMKSFTQMSNLQSHQRQHMKGKPFRCEQCFMSFDSKDELDVHVQAKHSGNRYAKVLLCPICTKSYNSETYLAKHVDRHKEAAVAASVETNNSVGAAAAAAAAVAAGTVAALGVGDGSPNCVDNLFGVNFHNHPVAMAAAAASALSRRGSMIENSVQNRVHNHLHTPQSQQEAASAAAAAVAQVRHDLHMRAVAAAAAANGVNRGFDLEQSCAFFNSNNTANLCEPRC